MAKEKGAASSAPFPSGGIRPPHPSNAPPSMPELKFPFIIPRNGPPQYDDRDASLLLDEEHLLMLTYIEKDLKDAYTTLLWRAISGKMNRVYQWVILRLEINAAERGYRSEQITSISRARRTEGRRDAYLENEDEPYPERRPQ